MSRARLRELVVLFAISSALTLAVFFLALWLLPFEAFTRFPLPRFLGFSEFHILWYCGLGRQSLVVRSHEGEQCPARPRETQLAGILHPSAAFWHRRVSNLRIVTKL